MIRFEDLKLFVRTTKLGNFSHVAREAGLLPGQVSAAILRLERELNVRLFSRTTRTLRLTTEGKKYLPYAHEMLELLRASEVALNEVNKDIKVNIIISLPSDVGRNILLQLISSFCETHSHVTFQLIFSDEVKDIYRDHIDISIRYGILPNSSLLALPLSEKNRRVLVASPNYIKRYGRPSSLEELSQHKCIVFSLNEHYYSTWRFPGSLPDRITVQSRIASNDAETSRRCAIAGLGIAYKSWIDIHQDVHNQLLEVLLPEIGGEPAPLYFICPHRKEFSPALRALYKHFKNYFKQISPPWVDEIK